MLKHFSLAPNNSLLHGKLHFQSQAIAERIEGRLKQIEVTGWGKISKHQKFYVSFLFAPINFPTQMPQMNHSD